MAHGITDTDGVVYYGTRPWHGLGMEAEDLMTAEQARAFALDWEVSQESIYMPKHGKAKGVVRIEDRVANVRDDNGEYLGTVSKTYTVFTNHEQAELIDGITHGNAAVDCAGSLQGGRRVFWAVRMGDPFVVKRRAPWLQGEDDVVEPYLTIASGHDGTMGVQGVVSPIRVVCQNTMSAVLTQSTAKVSMRHVGNLQERAQHAEEVLAAASESFQAATEAWAAAAKRKVTVAEVDAYLARVFPMPSGKPHQFAVQAVEASRATVRANYEGGQGAAPGTAWGLLNAVTEHATHSVVLPDDGSEHATAERRIQSMLQGRTSQLNDTASRAMMELLTV